MLKLTDWLSIYTALVLLALSPFSSTTTNAETLSVLDDRDVVVDLYYGSRKQTIHNRIGNKGHGVFGFRTLIPRSMNVEKVHIVYGEADVVCDIWSSADAGGGGSRQFSPTLTRVLLDSVVEDAIMLRCWLPEEGERKRRGARGRKMDKKDEVEIGADGASKPTLDDIKKALQEQDQEFREREERRRRREKWRWRYLEDGKR